MISPTGYYDGNAAPPQWSDGGGQVIEKGTHIRIKIKGIRMELTEMLAVATIKEDYLGCVLSIHISAFYYIALNQLTPCSRSPLAP